MSRLKIPLANRRAALKLLQRGFDQTRIAELMQSHYHPHAELEAVLKAYFPRHGAHVITTLVGKPREVIEARFQKMEGYSNRGRENFKTRSVDPAFAQRSAERLRAVNADPIKTENRLRRLRAVLTSSRVRQARAKRTSALHRTEDFRQKRGAAMQRFWAAQRSRAGLEQLLAKLVETMPQTAGPGLALPAEPLRPKAIGKIYAAVHQLPLEQRSLIAGVFKLEMAHEAGGPVAGSKVLSVNEIGGHLVAAFDALREDRSIRKILEGQRE
ncbi:MAG TPA: hypothetical protein VJI13_03880 [Candidatus Norongarragalinales archaeon]|nr:hypothetical protein [Candidatus Norongarragalinales archaeon]